MRNHASGFSIRASPLISASQCQINNAPHWSAALPSFSGIAIPAFAPAPRRHVLDDEKHPMPICLCNFRVSSAVHFTHRTPRGQRANAHVSCLAIKLPLIPVAQAHVTITCTPVPHTRAALPSTTDWLFPEPLPAIVHKLHNTVPQEPSALWPLWTHRPSTRTSRLASYFSPRARTLVSTFCAMSALT